MNNDRFLVVLKTAIIDCVEPNRRDEIDPKIIEQSHNRLVIENAFSGDRLPLIDFKLIGERLDTKPSIVQDHYDTPGGFGEYPVKATYEGEFQGRNVKLVLRPRSTRT
jgi:hypothetical protein